MAVKMHEPIGEAHYGPLLLRCSLGAYLLLSGLSQIDHLELFIDAVQRNRHFPEHVSTLYAILVPYLEVLTGALLIVGIWTTFAGIVSALMLGSFIFATGLFPYKNDMFTTRLFNKDVILLCAALSLLYTGAGAFSIDRFRKGG
ncbi:MAG: DoxX family protein [Oligoflexia bacterium]|nr:DoxX family protein [Oligoflexia bacterium]